ncbi:transporter substrate-binding domain-containing protein [Pseudorhodoplanes sp.]|uniref:transporter substrate-binding domain-containing protein n=1 Tax=Pseudorhodoplanes sp. TaxID=1934341 RepID=UPI003D10F400
MLLLARFSVAIIMVLTVAHMGAANAATCNADTQIAKILKRGKLLAGVRYDFRPAGYIDETGKNVGFGVDIAREFAKHLGVSVEFVATTSQTRVPLLQNGMIDAEFGVTTPEKVREEVVGFSIPYIWDKTIIMVKAGRSTKPSDYFQDPKSVIGATQGSNYVRIWQNLAPKANMRLYQQYPEIMEALIQGQVDVFLVSEATGVEMKKNLGTHADGVVIGDSFLADPFAIMMAPGDWRWRNWINWGLQRLWGEGTFQRLYKTYYNVEPSFDLWHGQQLQPRVSEIGKECDPW